MNVFTGEKQLIIDATEPAIQRPSDKEQQKECYSGKKRQTLKAMDQQHHRNK
ncbi:MAG: hypothetical protein NTW85_12855 [Methylococcales bacterium]|nr:hypothetical protein [Methylococcales bacterium]